MHNLSLYIPKLEDLWYEEKLQSNPDTMSYNASYDTSYYGYFYDTGCIYFSETRWEEIFNKRINENRYECRVLIDSSIEEKDIQKNH